MATPWRTAYNWFTCRAPRTWYAHGLVSLGAASATGLALKPFSEAPGAVIGASLSLAYFILREMDDELKYRRLDRWNDPRFEPNITPAVDQAGDLIGPVFVFLAALATWLTS